MPSVKWLFLFALMMPCVASAAPVDWGPIGLRVAMRDVVTQEGSKRMPFVVAVQEQSPAFFAGVQPGDVISFLRCGSWTYNYIDRSRTGTTHYRSHVSVGPTDFPSAADEASRNCRPDLTGLISVSTAPDDKRVINQFVEFRTTAAGNGRWIDTKAGLGAVLNSARAANADALTNLRARAATELRKTPCAYDVSNPYDLKAMPPIVQQMAAASRATGRTENLTYWRDVINVYCSDERVGKLPSFETAILLMSRGSLKPCDYDPAVDYSTIALDHSRQQRPYSKNEYNNYKDMDYMFGRLMDDKQRACFVSVMRSALGKP